MPIEHTNRAMLTIYRTREDACLRLRGELQEYISTMRWSTEQPCVDGGSVFHVAIEDRMPLPGGGEAVQMIPVGFCRESSPASPKNEKL